MPSVTVKTDHGVVIGRFDFPAESSYALLRMPGCPSHLGVHNLLNWLSRTLEEACDIQKRADRARFE